MATPFDNYYRGQAFPQDDIGSFYQSSYQVQRGRGIGSILSSLWRWFTPIAKTGAKKLGEQLLKTGSDIFQDLSTGGEPVLQVIKKRAGEGTKRLQTALAGQGLGHRNIKRVKICPNKTKTAPKKKKTIKKTLKKKKKKKVTRKIRDVFQPL